MPRFVKWAIASAVLGVGSVQAAEYRFEVSGRGSGSWGYTPIHLSFVVDKDSSAPAGYEVTYQPLPFGPDSLTWRNRREGLLGRTCLSCNDSTHTVRWLPYALAPAPLIPANSRVIETRQVSVEGKEHTYITAYSPGLYANEPATFSAYLSEVGTIFFAQINSGIVSSHGTSTSWSASVRLLEYNGVNIDTLWGDELPQPTAIAPNARHEPASRLKSRRFDMHEMGIFLGRKSALKTPLPRVR
jgi:hypothetical protein